VLHVIKGERNCTRTVLLKIARAVGLSAHQTAYFEDLVTSDQARTQSDKEFYLGRINEKRRNVKARPLARAGIRPCFQHSTREISVKVVIRPICECELGYQNEGIPRKINLTSLSVQCGSAADFFFWNIRLSYAIFHVIVMKSDKYFHFYNCVNCWQITLLVKTIGDIPVNECTWIPEIIRAESGSNPDVLCTGTRPGVSL
jgi:hypothetical protein